MGVKEKVEQEVRRTARGRSEETPALAHFGVFAVVGAFVGLLIAVALLVWWLA